MNKITIPTKDSAFKLCPFCKEQIREEAVKCRFCGEWLEPTELDSARTLTSEKPVLPPPIPPKEGADPNSMKAVGRALDEAYFHKQPVKPAHQDAQNKPPPKVSAKTTGDASFDGFKNPRSLANWLTVLLILMALFSGIAIWAGVLKLDLLSRAISGGQFSTEWARTVVYSSSPIADLLFFPTGILFFRWVYVAAKNARTIGMRNQRLFEHSFELAFTPGWSVGWYFVPFFCLWKPYQAMKWIWRASGSPADARDDKSGILPLWWTFWLLSNAISLVASKAGLTAQNPSDYTTAVTDYVISNAAEILSCVFTLLLVRRLSRRQLKALPNACLTKQPTTEGATIRRESGIWKSAVEMTGVIVSAAVLCIVYNWAGLPLSLLILLLVVACAVYVWRIVDS